MSYLTIVGVDEVKRMFINAAPGLLGIYAQIDMILSYSGKRAGDYSHPNLAYRFVAFTRKTM